MTRAEFLAKLKQRPMLCDGAMGTQLIQRGLKPGDCAELWTLDRPQDLQGVHRAYRQAGAELITTCSFGATATMLARHKLEDQLVEINAGAVRVARQGAGEAAVILGDVGPFGDFLEPVGDVTAETALGIFTQQMHALRQAGADGIIIETMSDPHEAALAVRAARRMGDWPVIATFAFQRVADGSFRTMMGATPAAALEAVQREHADVIGANCGTDLTLNDYAQLARELLLVAGDTPVIMQANAGSPHAGVYTPATPEQFAELGRELLAMGVKIVGGCCGTTPAHIAALAKVMPPQAH